MLLLGTLFFFKKEKDGVDEDDKVLMMMIMLSTKMGRTRRRDKTNDNGAFLHFVFAREG
jgi:hypothetical protein